MVIVQTRNSKWLLLFVTKLCVHCKNDQMAQGYLNPLSKSLSSQIVIQQYLHRKSYKVRISKSKAKEQNTCLLRSRFNLGEERYVTRPERLAVKVTRKTRIWMKHRVKIQWLLCCFSRLDVKKMCAS